MIKEKLYCPVKQGSFRMMFGFKMPSGYRVNKWKSVARVRITESSKRRDK